MRPTRTRVYVMNEFIDYEFLYEANDCDFGIEFTIRELIAYNLQCMKNHVEVFPSNQNTKQDKIDFMKGLVADIEKCISIIEADENADLWKANTRNHNKIIELA